MKSWWPAIVLLLATRAATADPGERCAKGLELAAKQDLPRASLYLERCDLQALDREGLRADHHGLRADPELASKVAKARADVAHKLDASKLSALSIVTTPEGLVAETDALPGERFTTPATIWARAGEYKINVAVDAATLDAGTGLTTTATLDAFSRRTVIINVPTKPAAPKPGKVDFTDETPEQSAHSGPPPAVKHGTMLPKKYLQTASPGGPLLDDPFASDGTHAAWRLGARIGGGMFTHDGRSSPGAAFSIAAIASRPLAGRLSLASRLGWAHRDLDAVTLDVGVGVELARSRRFALSTTGALRGEVRVQDELAMQPVARVGIGGALGLDFALLDVPVAIGLRVEPSFTELVPGARNHNALVELGWDWR